MVETSTKNTTIGAASAVLIVVIILASGLIGQENVYVCLDNEIAMKCPEGLSKVNVEGIQTRCKFFSEELITISRIV